MFAKLNAWLMHKTLPRHTKASSVSPLIACNVLGKPVWTPRNYQMLAEEGYQKNVIVYRCVNLIARGIASVPWLLYDHDEEIENHPLLDLLKMPSPQQAGSSFIEAIVGYLLLSGNSYVEAVMNHEGIPVELYPLRPDRMKVIPCLSGVAQAFEYVANGYTRRLDCDPISGKSAVLHMKNFHPQNDWYGLSPLEAAAQSIDQHNIVAEHNLALLQNGGRPSGALLVRPNPHSHGLSDSQRESLREDVRRVYEGGQNAGKVLILEGDFDWREMGLSPKDLDFIAGKNLSAREIAQAFGVPPMLVGVPGDATFSNYKEARFHLWEDTIMPLLEFLLSEMNMWLTPYFGENLRLSFDSDLIPALAPRREAIWAKVAAANFLTINEKRQAVGYSPLADGDVFMAPDTITAI